MDLQQLVAAGGEPSKRGKTVPLVPAPPNPSAMEGIDLTEDAPTTPSIVPAGCQSISLFCSLHPLAASAACL